MLVHLSTSTSLALLPQPKQFSEAPLSVLNVLKACSIEHSLIVLQTAAMIKLIIGGLTPLFQMLTGKKTILEKATEPGGSRVLPCISQLLPVWVWLSIACSSTELHLALFLHFWSQVWNYIPKGEILYEKISLLLSWNCIAILVSNG